MPRKKIKNSSFYEKIGEQIRKRREEKNITLEQLNKEADLELTKSGLSYIELGAQQISAYQLFRIAKKLNLSVDQLMSEAEKNSLLIIGDRNEIINVNEL